LTLDRTEAIVRVELEVNGWPLSVFKVIGARLRQRTIDDDQGVKQEFSIPFTVNNHV
jgi:hypothetical protein